MDIGLTPISGTGYWDWALNPTATDLAPESGLLSAIMMSLGTDRLANDDDILPDTQAVASAGGDRHGTWMDDTLDGSAIIDRMGCRWWLASRAKATRQTLNDVVFWVEESLDWMVQDKIAEQIDVTGEYVAGNPGVMLIAILITKANAQGSERYQFLWNSTTAELGLVAP